MKINIAKETQSGVYVSQTTAVDNLMKTSSFYGAVSLNVYDEVWDEIRVRCFDFYLVSDIPWKLDRVLKSYEY